VVYFQDTRVVDTKGVGGLVFGFPYFLKGRHWVLAEFGK